MTTGQQVLFWLGMVLTFRGILEIVKKRKRRELRRYEFEHRTSGGVVQFKTFEDSEEHNRKVKRTMAVGNPGCLLVSGLALIICALVWFLR